MPNETIPTSSPFEHACENSDSAVEDHFIGASKMVMLGSDAKREVEDMHLSWYEC